jgi:flagellum-specific peptidoglycan hydrolase FlgJ
MYPMSSRLYDDDPHNQLPSAQKRFSSSRREQTAPHIAARRNHTALRLPARDAETFYTRTTSPRLQAQDQPEQPILESDLLLIAGPDRPARHPARLSARMRVQLMGLVLLILLLVGAEGLVAQLSGDCTAQARQQGSCFAMDVFTALSGAQQVNNSAASTPAAPKLPAIPNDLPSNVHSFVVLALPYAVQAHQQLGWPLSVILAQWGLEHGWSVPDAQGYNWGNTTFAPDCPYQGSRFCYASTPKEGLREYVYTARLSYYDDVRAAVAKGADSTALALGRSPWDAGHYGGAENPGSLLLAILRNFNFYRFDTAG